MINRKNNKQTYSRARELFDSLLSDKDEKSALKQYLGNIDGLVGQTLSGWVIDEKNLDAPVELDVYFDSIKVGSGSADIYRKDLQEVGYGNGQHGFQIELSSHIFKSGKHQLSLREAVTGAHIASNRFPVSFTADCVATISGIEGRVIRAQIEALAGNKLPASVEVLVDGSTKLPCALLNQSGKTLSCEAQLPADLYDGMPHTFEVVANDSQCSSTAYVEILYPISTPDEHFADSTGKPGYIGLPRTAAFRYESLSRYLTKAAEQAGADDLQNYIVAHEQVLKGFHGRREYSNLRLPRIDEPDVSIIIPAKNKFPITYHCISSLILAQNNATFEVILVDDESEDETTAAEEIIDNLRVVRNEINLGFVKANNKAAIQARGKYICLLNNDTEVTSGWIDEALEMFGLYSDVGSVGCKLIYPDGKLQEAGGIVWGSGAPWNYGKNQNASHPQFNYARQADYLSAAALFVDRSVWQEVGGFSEEFAPAYYEDTDLAFKIRDAGYNTLYCPTSTVVHFEGKSNGTSTSSGIKRYQDINSKKFRSKWFSAYKSGAPAGENPHLEVDRVNNFRVLVLDANTPSRNSDAGSYAAIQEMKLMMEHRCKLTFVPSNLAHMGVHTEHLQKLGVECIYYPFFQSIEQFIQDRGMEFDAVYVTRYQVAQDSLDIIRKYTGAKVIFNNADLHFLREIRQQLQSEDKEMAGPLVTREKELSVIEEVDVAICYTEAERAVITSHVLKEDNVIRCPWVVQSASQRVPFQERQNIAFLGGYRHTPNVEAVEFFCSKVMPSLTSRLPDLVFNIYGSHMPDEFEVFQSDNIVLHGFVENISDVYEKNRLFVSPLISGAGLKGKIIECMAAGLPSVISPVSVEGTGLVHTQSTFVADTVDEWCGYIEQLYSDEELWYKMSDNSLSIADSLYSPNEGMKQMRKILEAADVFSGADGKGKFRGYLQ